MRLLTTTAAIPFTFRVTRTRRRAVVNEIAETITLDEVTTTLTITLPSFVKGVKDTSSGLKDKAMDTWQDIKAGAAVVGNALLDALLGGLMPKVCPA